MPKKKSEEHTEKIKKQDIEKGSSRTRKKSEEKKDTAKEESNVMDYKDYDKLLARAYDLLPSNKGKSNERFNLPELDIIIEGNKTIIKNFQQIAEKIRRQKEEIAVYLKKELGAPVKIEDTSLIIQKKIKPEFLKRRIEVYIEDFVMCQECKRPDTHIASIQGIKFIICEACGARRALRK